MTPHAIKAQRISAAHYAAQHTSLIMESGRTGKLRTLALAAGVLLCSILPAHADPFTIQKVGGLFGGSISSVGVELKKAAQLPNSLYPPESFTITYADATTHKVVTATATSSIQTGGLRFTVNADPGTITVVNNTEPTIAPQFASINSFDPPNNSVVTAYVVNSGSILTFDGHAFVMSGEFTGIDTTLNRDPTSASFGVDGGSFVAFNLLGTGAIGSLELTLTGDPSYSHGLAPLWALLSTNGMLTAGGLPTTTQINVAGTLTFNSTLIPFFGTFDDTTTFFDDGSTIDSETVNLMTADGPITGSFSGSGTPSFRPVPEPGTLSLLGLGVAFFGSVLRKPTREKARSKD